MATLNSFPNNVDEYIGAEEVMRWLHGRTSGVYGTTGNAVVTAVANSMAVSVSAGIGWINDADGNGIVWWFNDAVELEIDAAEPTGTKNRIDRIVVQWRTVDYADKPELVVLKGTDTAGTATPPALTNTSTLRQISLAKVSIPAGTTAITNLLITDERADTSVCGIVTESVTADTSLINSQYQAALAELESAIAQAWGGEISDGSITWAKLAASLRTLLNNKVLYLTNVTCSATTGNFISISNNSAITANHVVARIDFAKPAYITADYTWTTGNGTLTVNGKCSAATTASIVLVEKGN